MKTNSYQKYLEFGNLYTSKYDYYRIHCQAKPVLFYWKRNDRQVSIETKKRFIKMKVPDVLKNRKYKIVGKLKSKSFFVNNLEILVALDLIIKALIKGQYFVETVKIHVSKKGLI